MGDIFQVPPKRTLEVYRGHKVEYVYEPDHKTWGFRFVRTQEFVVEGSKRTLDDAVKEAHKRIDKLCGD